MFYFKRRKTIYPYRRDEKRNISVSLLQTYLPNFNSNLPAVVNKQQESSDFSNEREILYKILFDMKKDLNDLKQLTKHLNSGERNTEYKKDEKKIPLHILEHS